jgi:hypothetical protein
MKLQVKVDNKISPMLKKMQTEIKNLPSQALKVFVEETPVRNGNARRNTKLNKNSIQANYPYAQKLNEGYSKQSPEGMTQPTTDYIIEQFNKIMTGK